MELQLQADLQAKIQQWLENSCEDEHWPLNFITGQKTVRLMTQAAVAVFDAIIDALEYAVAEGFLKE